MGTVGRAADNPLPVYPDDAYSRPAVDHLTPFETRVGVCSWTPQLKRADNFTTDQLTLVQEGALWRTRWQFRRKAGHDAVPGLTLPGDWIRRAPLKVSFKVANRSAKPVRFALHFTDGFWQQVRQPETLTWQIDPSVTVAPGEERVVDFPFANAKRQQTSTRTAILYPITFNIFVANTVDETPYDLVFNDLTVTYPDAAGIAPATLTGPAQKVAAGSETTFTLHLATPLAATSRTLDLEARREPWVMWRVRLTAAEKAQLAQAGQTTIRRTVPANLAAEELTVGLVADGYRVPGTEAKLAVDQPAPAPALPQTERKLYHGRPTLFVNGQPFPWMAYSSYAYQPGNVNEFGASGVNCFLVPVDAGIHVHQGIAQPTWVAPDRFDFSELEERVQMALAANPNAMIALRASLSLPYFWLNQHPDDRARIRTGAGPASDIVWEETSNQVASLTSTAWREAQAQALRELIRYCKGRPWASRMIGVMISGGVTEEWFSWGCNDGQYGDYSPVNRQAFKNWCATRKMDYDDIPGTDTRNRGGYDYYPNDRNGRWAAAYGQFDNDVTSETIGYFAKVIKDETQGRALAFVFYGYVIQLAGEGRQHLGGHFGLRQLIDDPNIDMISGVPELDWRDLTNGYTAYLGATESIMAGGKVVYLENDLFSWLHNYIWNTPYDPADPRGGAIKMHQRQIATNIIHSVPEHWFSLFCTWHHDAGLQAEIANEVNLFKKGLDYDRAPAEEVAFVVDDASFAWYPTGTGMPGATNRQQLYTLGRSGAPVGVWLLSDVDKLPERVKFVVIAGAPAARPADLAKLKALIEKGGRTVLAVGPVGMIDPDKQEWDLAAPGRLLGLPVVVDDSGIKNGEATLTAGNVNISQITMMRPRARLTGSGLALYKDGQTAMGERPLAGGGRLLWSGVPVVNAGAWRGLLAQAGVHLYAPENFFVHASKDLVAVTSPFAGSFDLQWPREAAVHDLFDGWTGKGQTTPCPFTPGQTRLFEVKLNATGGSARSYE